MPRTESYSFTSHTLAWKFMNEIDGLKMADVKAGWPNGIGDTGRYSVKVACETLEQRVLVDGMASYWKACA